MPFETPVNDLAPQALRSAFERLSPELDAFAARHSLLVERYQLGFSMWTFLFQHPKGGAASLQFNIAIAPETGELSASLLPHWWLDIEPEQRRLAADFPTVPVASLAAADVRYALERALDQVIGTEESALTREVWIRRSYRLPNLPWPR